MHDGGLDAWIGEYHVCDQLQHDFSLSLSNFCSMSIGSRVGMSWGVNLPFPGLVSLPLSLSGCGHLSALMSGPWFEDTCFFIQGP